MSSDVFLSYQSADSAVAEQLARQLERHGLHVFLDRTLLVAGEIFDTAIVDELRTASSVLVLLSRHIRRDKWVESALQDALADKQNVVPVLLDDNAKENWIWPLLADRQAVINVPELDNSDLIRQILPALREIRTSARGSWQSLEDSLSQFSDDFLEDRAQPPQQQREMLDP